jgi:methyl-accepting chemotaxis protein
VRFKDIRIAYRPALGFGIVIAVILAAAATGSLKAAKLRRAVGLTVYDTYPQLALANSLSIEVNKVSGGLRELLLVDAGEAADEALARIANANNTIGGILADLSSFARGEDEQRILRRVEAARADFRPYRACRRGRARIRGRRVRSARPGSALGVGRQGNQDPDQSGGIIGG